MDVLPIKRILLVGAGRRAQLAQYLTGRVGDSYISLYSYELTDKVPISWVTETIVGKRYSDPDFLADVERVVQEYEIDLVIPCQDEACYVLSQASFIDKVLVSPRYTCKVCYDKLEFWNFFESFDFYPNAFFATERTILKPRFGQSGRGIRKCTGSTHYDVSREVMQEEITGQEWTVDCYFDKDCKFVDAVPRKRLRVFDGEVISSVTDYNKEVYALCMHIGSLLRFRGPINMQFIQDKDGKFWLTEINARFGGGYTLSMASGLNVLALIGRDYFGIECDYKPLMWNSGLRVERALQDFYFSEEKCV